MIPSAGAGNRQAVSNAINRARLGLPLLENFWQEHFQMSRLRGSKICSKEGRSVRSAVT